jgi:HPt (histidine-containing phosphotransfer) domain-containing protein
MSNKIPVTIDKDLESIVPGFLKHRAEDIVNIQEALQKDDFPTMRSIGHKLKGNAGGYGFDELGFTGARLEVAAENNEKEKCQQCLAEIIDYLKRVEITFA